LEVTNLVAMQPGSTTRMEISRPSSSDKLTSPALFLDGSLVVTNVGALLHAGDTFDLFDGTLSGTFASVLLPNYYSWSTANLYINGTISVTAVLSPPQISNIAHSGTDVTLSAINGAPNGTVIVLTSTDLSLPIASWTQVLTSTFDGGGNFTSAPIPVTPGEPKRFFVLLAQ
jgi:hypothetical protein